MKVTSFFTKLIDCAPHMMLSFSLVYLYICPREDLEAKFFYFQFICIVFKADIIPSISMMNTDLIVDPPGNLQCIHRFENHSLINTTLLLNTENT